MKDSILILGGGCFGLTSAIELRSRGWRVTLVDQGRLPHPDAASTDISKVVRMDYGRDEQHTAMGEQSIARWREWNARWGQELFHECGYLLMSPDEMKPGGFEHDCHDFLTSRGHVLRRTGAEMLRKEHPAWNAAHYRDGYLNPVGGWVESGRVIARLAEEARAAGVQIIENAAGAEPEFAAGRCLGLSSPRESWRADLVLVAAGAWTPSVLPHLGGVMRTTAQTVVHFQPRDPVPFTPPHFPVWAADIGRTGWYGFPANADGLVKVANHGPGRSVDPRLPRAWPEGEVDRYRAFLRETFPGLAEAPVHSTRVCLYCDTFDGAFWIDHDPAHPGLVVAAGDSGHAFKFTPVLGGLIADVIERKTQPLATRYRWREKRGEAADGARAAA